ncbi:hypothetical protein I350_02832 [Cryptococcus amylolentus CBS 6273]|uniref:MHYT domain-containing protein n=1 Tax=Cryptococcus amylolentus CBS 6273 TaxID=1296118 RepID=A0A1E3KAD4_9TREE|nr:hypothetical protein I350_02832 [Cryptococcus amylolentus CBS 6273]
MFGNSIASSSTPSEPTPPSTALPARPPPRSSRRQMPSSAAMFVFAMVVPMVAANPIPIDSQTRPRLRISPSSIADLLPPNLPSPPSMGSFPLVHLFSAAGESLARRTNVTGPILDVALYDPSSQAYRLPENYIKLHQHLTPGYIFLSYAIAFVGSLCTLELLIRRTTNSGWRNQVLLTAAGICFGAVSTFAMHFIFNNALVLKHPLHSEYPNIYLAYNAGFTVLSLVVSCLAMTFAFYVMGTKFSDWSFKKSARKSSWGRIKRGSDNRASIGKADADEYREWKSTHRKVLRRGTIGPGIFARGGSQSNWSALEPEGASQRPSIKDRMIFGSRIRSGWKDDMGNMYGERDKDLRELEFRLGKVAVERELAKRANGDREDTQDDCHPPSRRPSIILAHDFACQAPSSRRGSAIFTPGFNFPPSTFSQTHHEDPGPLRPASPDNSFPTSARLEWRRSSLPTDMLPSQRIERPFPGHTDLARIQSLPEGDVDPNLSTSLDQSHASQGSQSEDEGKGSLEDDVTELNHEKSDYNGYIKKKKTKMVDKNGVWGKLGVILGFDVVTLGEVIKIFVTGAVAGFGVVGMHYIGQASIVGIPYVAYRPGYVVGSVVIACGAVIIALYIMFIMLRPKLKHTWWSKILVALILAVAVCAMHFCGMMGTIYAWPRDRGTSKHAQLTGTNAAITGVVAALAFSACIACAVFFVLHSLHQRREQARRRRVVVASVMFDDRDRILVSSTDGMLPMCDIANLSGGVHSSSGKASFIQSMTSDSTVLGLDLSTGHEAFVSALRLSWLWKSPAGSHMSASGSIDGKSQTQSENAFAATLADIRRGSMGTSNTTTTATGSRAVPISITKFLEKFSISAGQLALRLTGQMNGITRLGVLYDQILTTGWVKLENSEDTVSKGQLIFLVRRVTSAAERFDLQSRHFMFAEPAAVASALHRTLSVPYDHIMPLLGDIRTFCDSTVHCTIQPGKLYAGVAVVQATPFDGLRILLEKDNRSQLPMREICTLGAPPSEEEGLSGTAEEIGEALSLLQGLTMLSVITRNVELDIDATDQALSQRVNALLAALERAIVPMLDDMLTGEDMTHILPRLSLHPILIPLTPGGRQSATLLGKRSAYTPPYTIVFYANYDAAVNTFTDQWLPFGLFRAQSSCVTAQKVQVGQRMEKIWAETDEESGHAPGRRPSKVQFDFPSHSGGQSSSTAASSSGSAFDNNLFNGFSFTPKTEDGVDAGNPASVQRRSSLKQNTFVPTQVRKNSPLPSRVNSVASSSEGPIGGSITGTLGLGIRDVNMGLGTAEGANMANEIVMRQVLPGVGLWDQDWLLNLLRSKLRAQA